MQTNRAFALGLTLAAGLALASGSAQAAATTWAGDLLNVQVLDPNPQTVAFNGNFIVPTTVHPYILNPGLTLDITAAGRVTFSTTVGNTFVAPSIIKITDLTAARILNVQVNPSSTVLPNTPLIAGNNFFQFNVYNFPNHSILPGTFLALDVAFQPDLGAAVPEPVSLALFGGGLLGLALVRRRRRGGVV